MTSIAYPVTLNQIFYHSLAFPFGGLCEISNNTRYHVYVAIGYFAQSSDVIAQSVARIPPFQTRRFISNVRQSTPHLSCVPSDIPFVFQSNIAGSQNLVRVSEESNPKGSVAQSSEVEGIAADYIIIAGGRVIANQFGLFVTDVSGNAAFALAGDAVTWDTGSMVQGDLVVGGYFSGTQGMYWDSAAATLRIIGNVDITGGSGITVENVSGTWTVVDESHLSVSGAAVRFTGGLMINIISQTYLFGGGLSYLYVDVTGGTQTLGITGNISTLVYPRKYIGFFSVGAVGERGSLYLAQNFTKLGSGQLSVIQLSALSADLGTITAGLVTGATIRTDSGTIPNAQLDTSGLQIKADNQGWVYWKDVNGLLVAQINGWTPGAGSPNLLTLTANPGLLSGGGDISSVAQSANSNASAQFRAVANNTVNDYASLAVRDSTGQVTQIDVKPNLARILSSPNAAGLTGLIIGGSPRTPSAMLDINGGIYATGNGQINGNFAVGSFIQGSRFTTDATDPGATNARLLGNVRVGRLTTDGTDPGAGNIRVTSHVMCDRLSTSMTADPGSGNAGIYGYIIGSQPKGARAYRNASKSISNATWTVIDLNTEEWDNDVCHDNVTNNSRLTCKTAGYYQIIFQFAFDRNTTGDRWGMVRLNANGSSASGTLVGFSAKGSPKGANTDYFDTITCFRYLNVNDYVEGFMYQDSGGALNAFAYLGVAPGLSIMRMA